jgi:pimeloyl-ACP methyl ester carboxylesterase
LKGPGLPSDRPELIRALAQLLELEQVTCNRRFSTVDGLRVHHLEAGVGRPLVLLHGASGGNGNWYRMLKPLAAQRRVLALDLPGFGLSEGYEPRYPLGRQAAAFVTRWLDVLGVRHFDIVATSFGGLVALRLAQQAPGRVGRLALINSVGLGREVPWPLRAASFPPFSSFALRPSRLGLSWQFRNLMTSDRSHLSSAQITALLEYLWQVALAGDPRRIARAFSLFGDVRGQREILSDDELRGLRLPVLMAWGGRDRILPLEHGQRAAALVPEGALRIIPRAGHSPNWEAPEVVLECFSGFLRTPLAR